MSPILVRPVREQLEHDRIIRLLQAAGWIEDYRRFWTPYMDALERHLDHMKQHAAPAKKKAAIKRRVIKAKLRKRASR